MNLKDKVLLSYVRKELNSGKTKIIIPSALLSEVSDEVLIEIRRLCKLNGVSISIDA